MSNIPKGTAKEFSADKLFACSCFHLTTTTTKVLSFLTTGFNLEGTWVSYKLCM